MSLLHAILILLAGMAAGTINAAVGSGTLITFPVLIGLGYGPVVANMSNNVGLCPGGLSGALGYRRELEGQRPRALRLACGSTAGAALGATLLLTLPASAFEAVVPVFIVLALLSVVFQAQLGRAVARRRSEAAHGGPAALLVVFVLGIYGGYFGAAQGILLVATLALLLGDRLQRVNALKNVLATAVNTLAAVVFIAFGTLDWGVVGLIAAGSIVGGQLGAHLGRRLPDVALRALIVAVGCFAIVKLWAG
jgi:uncharacterized membrane protein YfcA